MQLGIDCPLSAEALHQVPVERGHALAAQKCCFLVLHLHRWEPGATTLRTKRRRAEGDAGVLGGPGLTQPRLRRLRSLARETIECLPELLLKDFTKKPQVALIGWTRHRRRLFRGPLCLPCADGSPVARQLPFRGVAAAQHQLHGLSGSLRSFRES
eukprot:scaffold7182_cov258-Pinguiococcus_pyrenoidosus.AAC.3